MVSPLRCQKVRIRFDEDGYLGRYQIVSEIPLAFATPQLPLCPLMFSLRLRGYRETRSSQRGMAGYQTCQPLPPLQRRGIRSCTIIYACGLAIRQLGGCLFNVGCFSGHTPDPGVDLS